MQEITPATKKIIHSITCDCCKVKYDDIFEIQEFLSWEDVAGYGNSNYGDGSKLALDLCQYCTANLLSRYIRREEDYV